MPWLNLREDGKDRGRQRCSACGLRIRGGDRERHEAGYHHNRRLATLQALAKK